MRHKQRQVCVVHDVSGSAAKNRLPQPVPCEGSLDQQIAAVRLGRSEDRFSSAPAFEFDAHQFGGNVVVLQLFAHFIGRWARHVLSTDDSQHCHVFGQA